MTLSRDAILAADDLPTKIVNVPAWGGDVRLRSLSALETIEWSDAYAAAQGEGEKGNLRLLAVMVALSVVDEQGNRMFSDADVPALMRRNGTALRLIFDAALELNGMTAAATEEISKNSEAEPSGNSASS